jgi:hypothetical protein
MSNIPGSSQSHVVIIHTKKGVERYQIKGKLNRGKSKYALKKKGVNFQTLIFSLNKQETVQLNKPENYLCI